MAHYKLAFLGFGNVGRALAQLLIRKKTELKEKHDITFSVTGIATGSHGSLVNQSGIELLGTLELVRSSRSLSLLTSELIEDSFDFIQKCKADILFENTSVNHETGQPALDHIKTALELGMHVCTANKGPVVHGYRELRDLADANGVRFLHESTVMDGAPIRSV